jgi:hypothetical protein
MFCCMARYATGKEFFQLRIETPGARRGPQNSFCADVMDWQFGGANEGRGKHAGAYPLE